jgi:hypothetical protein
MKTIEVLPVFGLGLGFEYVPEAKVLFFDFLCFRFIFGMKDHV